MSLKDEIRARMRESLWSLAIALAFLGVYTWFAFITPHADWRVIDIALATWMTLSVFRNIRRYFNGRAILRNPLFILLAIKHDLGTTGHFGSKP